jgi:hypothetical protein
VQTKNGALYRGLWAALLLWVPVSSCSTSAHPSVNVAVSSRRDVVTFESLGAPQGILLSGVGVASWGPRRLDVFATGSDHALWHKSYDATWHDWESLGGHLGSGPAAVSWGPRRIDVAAVDSETQMIVVRTYDGGWDSWQVRGTSAVEPATPGLSSSGPGRLDVFARNGEGRVVWMYFDARDGGWHESWQSLGGAAGFSDLSAVSWGAGRIDVIGSSSKGGIEHFWTTDSGASWNDATAPDEMSGFVGAAVASRAYGLLDLFFGDQEGRLRHRAYDVDWIDGVNSGATVRAAAAVSPDPGRVEVFGYDAENRLVHAHWTTADDVVTQHNSPLRTGLQSSETVLNTRNVNTGHFGLLTRLPVDGEVFAQPLFASNLPIGGTSRNVVFVATENDSVYAFDADSFEKLWSLEASMGHPLGIGVPVPQPDIGNHGWYGNNMEMTGITSTPVIDVARGNIYVEAFSAMDPTTGDAVQMPTCAMADCPMLDQPPHVYRQKLYAIDILTGTIRQATVIEGSASGVTFDPRQQLQRAGMLLLEGSIYLGFGSYTDAPPYRGWVLKYDADVLALPSAAFATSDETGDYVVGPGIWQSGQGLASDGTAIFLMTGNGSYDGAKRWGDSFLALSPSLDVKDSFTPWNQEDLRNFDRDLGSSGPVLIDHNRLVGGGKAGVLYVLNRSDLGGYLQGEGTDIGADRVIQSFQATWPSAPCPWRQSNIHGAPVVWRDPSRPNASTIYVWGELDWLRAYVVTATDVPVATTPSAANLPASTCDENGCPCYDIYACGVPASHSTFTAPCGMPGAILSVSASGSIAGTGIVWAAMPVSLDANHASVPGILRAFDAQNVARELWNSDMVPSDVLGNFGKFAPPTIANGKVFVATQSNQVDVYGLFSEKRYSP